MKKEKIELLTKTIKKIINFDNKLEGQYGMPYQSDGYADYEILYDFDKISLWETERYVDCKYSGSLYVKITSVRVGYENDWEKFKYVSDLPSWIEDDLKDKILDSIEMYLPMVCVDLTLTYD